MTLTNLVRGLVGLLICYTIAALSWGVLDARGVSPKTTNERAFSPSYSDAVPAGGARPFDGPHVLVDTRTGALEPIRLPDQERWGNLSVAPWRDRDGNLLAAGRWVRAFKDESEEPLWGLGVLRLPETSVLLRTPLNVLPTGRPCWLADAPGSVVFPAADGRIYKAELDLDADPAATRPGPIQIRPIHWAHPPAGDAAVFIQDPAVSADPRLRRLVFAAVSLPGGAETLKKSFLPSRLWWLELADDGERIVAAGPLTAPGRESLEKTDASERHPGIAVQGDRIRLVYLVRESGGLKSTLREHEIELDLETGRPRVRTLAQPATAAQDSLVFGPLLVAADGGSVFALDRFGKNARLRVGPR